MIHPQGLLRLCALLSVAALAACASSAAKPVDTPELRKTAQPDLAAFLERAVGGDAKLVKAEPFSEGFMHETWKLTAEVAGKQTAYALKIFEDEAAAKRDESNHRTARELGWPVPEDVVRGPAAPYKSLPSALLAFVPGESLAGAIQRLVKADEAAAPAAIAKVYGKLGERLGALHAKGKRARQQGDISGTAGMMELAERCDIERWCGPYATKQFRQGAEDLDGKEVTFVHGALHEAQIILNRETGDVASFVDLDEAGYGDPALDVGTVLSHMLLVNPVTREAAWGVAAPGAAELKASAEAFLGAYKASAGVAEGWEQFMSRVRGYMRVRVGRLLLQLRGNVHAKALIELVDKRKIALFVIDPFEDYKITP